MDWKIESIESKDGIILSAFYKVTLNQGPYTISTEGHCDFPNPTNATPFAEVNEAQVIRWIKEKSSQNGFCSIESRLQEQLDNLEKKEVKMPWVKTTFKPAL